MTLGTAPAEVLVLGGTREARALAAVLEGAGVPVLSSLAGRVSNPALPVGEVRIGGFGGVSGLASFLSENGVRVLVDATHPFAAGISANAVAAAEQAGVPLVRLLRPGWRDHPNAGGWTWVDRIEAAAAAMAKVGQRPFLTTGRQGLAHFASWRSRWALVRLVEPPEDEWPNWTILRSRGPYDADSERALMVEHRVDVLVSKDSGGPLTEAKLDVAAELGIKVVMVARPVERAADVVPDPEAAAQRVLTLLGGTHRPAETPETSMKPQLQRGSRVPNGGFTGHRNGGFTGHEDKVRADWVRPVPLVGDPSAAAERADDPRGWAFEPADIEALGRILNSRRDIRRFRPDPVPEETLDAILAAGHAAPSVGHSQPWRFIVVTDPAVRDRAAALADRMRLEQAAGLTADRARRLLDLKLEGLREAPVGVVVACDRRTPAAGVLGRASFPDTDLWSCACAIQNMWLTARAHGVGMGWVTLFQPSDLAELLGLPEGVETLGWLCLGWPDERPPEPGLQRHAWSSKLPLSDVVLRDRWPDEEATAPSPPASHLRSASAPSLSGDPADTRPRLRGPAPERLVTATDAADQLLTPPESLGVLDRALNRILAAGPPPESGTLVLVGADHLVAELGVSAFPASTTAEVFAAAVAGESLGAATALTAGLKVLPIDAGVAEPVAGAVAALPVDPRGNLRDADAPNMLPIDAVVGEEPVVDAVAARPVDPRGNLRDADAMTRADAVRLIEAGRTIGRAQTGLVVLGEVGIGNTTVAAALACALTGMAPSDAVGLGAGSDAVILATKIAVVEAALERSRVGPAGDPLRILAAVGGPEFAVLTGVTLGAAEAGATVVLDGLATSVAALLATRMEPAVQAYLIAGQVSREQAHELVLRHLGLEPLLQLRLRAGEGVGGCLAASLLLQALHTRARTGRTQ